MELENKTLRNIVFVLMIVTILPIKCFAWGREGHQIVADIAFQFLDANTKKNVLSYLGDMSIEDASTWMDDIRSTHQYNYMESWHFVNIGKDQKYSSVTEPNVISVLTRTINELEHKNTLSKERIKTDILILMHLTGDIQQPLHCGYGSDEGGNSVEVYFLHNRKKSSLHHVWDSDIIREEQISVADCMNIYRGYKVDDVVKVISGSVLDWANESRFYLPQVYAYSGKDIRQNYITKNKTVIENQLLNGGLRLASLLLTCFGI